MLSHRESPLSSWAMRANQTRNVWMKVGQLYFANGSTAMGAQTITVNFGSLSTMAGVFSAPETACHE